MPTTPDNKFLRVGIIGGLGSETSCNFCLKVNTKFRMKMGCQPDIILENLPVSEEAERKLIQGEASPEHFRLLLQAVRKLNAAEVDFLVIPCNTVHIFHSELQRRSLRPIINIIEVCAQKCKQQKFTKVGLLATTKTIQARLHQQELEKVGIEVLLPSTEEQRKLTLVILSIINRQCSLKQAKMVEKIIASLHKKGAEAIILGCTDLPLVAKKKNIPFIDTCALLEERTVELLMGG